MYRYNDRVRPFQRNIVTDTKLSAEQIAGFAGLQVPEPASASLGILGLAVLMMRRRRS